MKALLVSREYPLYSEVWNDQPPLHTELLAILFRLFGPSAYVGRLLSVSFAMVLVAALYSIVGARSGRAAGVLAVILLMSSSVFLQLSASAMLELPAMAVGLAAAWACSRYRASNERRWLVFSGIFFGCALQVKFTAIIFLPALAADYFFHCLHCRREGRIPPNTAVGLTLQTAAVWQAPAATPAPVKSPGIADPAAVGLYETAAARGNTGTVARGGVWRGGRGAAVWSVAALATFSLIMALLYHWNTFTASWASHFSEGTKQAAGMASASYAFHPESLANNLALAAPAAAGLLAVAFLRRRELLFPAVLFLTALGIHLWRRPYWYYYDLHYATPLAWLGAAGIVEWFRFLWQCRMGASLRPKLLLGVGLFAWAAVVSLVVTLAPGQIWNEAMRLRAAVPASQDAMVAAFQQQAPHSRWIFTERLIAAFWAGMPIPPELAVIPSKRLWSGQISHDAIIQCLDRYRPEVISLDKDQQALFGLAQYLQDHYRPDPANLGVDLLLRRSGEGRGAITQK